VNVFTVVYIFLVPRKNVDKFLRIQQAASEIYRSHGALEEETFALVNHEAKYGCVPFTKGIDVGEDEEVFVSLSRFPDKTHHDQVMVKIDSDPRIDQLYREINGVVEVGRVLRGEFERVV
jgi:uncharacterized protein YbaA (DUF1428 family)